MKFSIRDILWLTILVAALVAWWLDHRSSSLVHEQMRQQAEQLQFQVRQERADQIIQRRSLEAQARDHEEHVRSMAKKLGLPWP